MTKKPKPPSLPFVNWTSHYNPRTGQHSHAGWNISVHYKGELRAITTSGKNFASKRDAEMGLKSLIEAGGVDYKSILKLGKAKVGEIIYGCLPW